MKEQVKQQQLVQPREPVSTVGIVLQRTWFPPLLGGWGRGGVNGRVVTDRPGGEGTGNGGTCAVVQVLRGKPPVGTPA